ncbi:MAG: rRNA adenine N-6-methyltransferase family protein [Phototrophicaceae bacterium]
MANKKRSNKPGKPNKKRDDRPRGRRGKGSNTNRNDKPSASKKADDTFEIKMKAMANGGFAIGSNDRRMTFIPYTIPGETVRARIVNTQKSVDFAEGVELVQASADRVYPQCPHFGPNHCWSCQWQHINYEAQLLLKQDVVADQLYRVGKFKDIVIERALKPVIPSPQQWAYNYNVTMTRDKDGSFGYYKIDGRQIEAVNECHVLHPELQQLFSMIDIDFADVRRMQLWVGSDDKTMTVLEMKTENMPQLTADFPTSVNVVLPDNEPANLVGDSAMFYEVAERLFRVTVGSSFRANVAQIYNLIATILDMLNLSEHDSVLDLYAGVGIFSAFIAPRAGLVTLVESYPPTATDAEENLQAFDNVDIIEGSVEEVLASLLDAGEIYESAVLDPPSSGLSKTVISQLKDLNIPKLVYISGDPSTLARDAQALSQLGYALERVQPIDFAPQTYYIDTVALLVKG